MAKNSDDPAENSLTGNYFIRRLDSAIHEVEHLFRHTRDRIEIRRHALKLRFWPTQATADPAGRLVDLDWSYIQTVSHLKISELRIHDTIGGCDNLRIIFFVGPCSDLFPKTCIWVLAVFQKKRDDFTLVQIRNFRARRKLVLIRYYGQAAEP